MKRKGPTTNRHRSAQDHGSPWEFMSAIEKRFDLVEIDLAATKANAKAGRFISPRQNSLKQDWTAMLEGKMGYLNPEWDPIAPWIEKVVIESTKGARFVVLSQAPIDSNWFWKIYPLPFCTIYPLKSRIKFVGSKDVFPKTLMVSAFNLKAIPGPELEIADYMGQRGQLVRWHWKLDTQ